MQVSPHGGGCCGVSHIHSIPIYSEQSDFDLLYGGLNKFEDELKGGLTYASSFNQYSEPRDEDNNEGNFKRKSRLYEIILNANQIREADNVGILQLLKDYGFVPVSKFVNSNSGSVCVVFHLVGGPPCDPADMEGVNNILSKYY
tara:strand:+ start:341 stop:772 length:432 start_codon:yes stop_codon:yes gene_type:complete